MKNLCVFFLFMVLLSSAYAQVEPPLPSPCYSYGPASKNNLTVSGNTTFTFSNLTDFSVSEALNNISVTVESSDGYKLYIAGEMTAITGSSANTPIPINTFTISATNRGTAPSSITLSNSYLEVAQRQYKTNGLTHVLTITRNPLNTFTQAPGMHTLTLHIRYCQY